LADIYDAEPRGIDAQQQLLQQASDQQPKGMLQTHIDQTQQQIQNLEQIYNQMGQRPERQTCEAAQGLVSEGQKKEQEAPGGSHT
jgi:ferritin-like metal-binding protein YciE